MDIADDLLEAARVQAAKEHQTLQDLIEEGLRHVLRSGSAATVFSLRDASFGSKGLCEGVENGTWHRLPVDGYEGRDG